MIGAFIDDCGIVSGTADIADIGLLCTIGEVATGGIGVVGGIEVTVVTTEVGKKELGGVLGRTGKACVERLPNEATPVPTLNPVTLAKKPVIIQLPDLFLFLCHDYNHNILVRYSMLGLHVRLHPKNQQTENSLNLKCYGSYLQLFSFLTFLR